MSVWIEIACDQTCFKVHSKHVRADCNRQSRITVCNSFDLDMYVGNLSFDLFSALNFMELWLDYLWWAVLRAKLNKISHPFSWSSKALSLLINQCAIYLKQRPLDILSVSAKYRRKNVWKTVSFDVCGIAYNISTSKCIKRNATKTRMTKNMMWSNESAVSHEAAWSSSNTHCTVSIWYVCKRFEWYDDRLSFVNVIFSQNNFFFDRFVYMRGRKKKQMKNFINTFQ